MAETEEIGEDSKKQLDTLNGSPVWDIAHSSDAGTFVYDTIEDAPQGHRDAAAMWSAGLPDSDIARQTGYSEHYLQRIKAHPVIQSRTLNLQKWLKAETLKLAEFFRGPSSALTLALEHNKAVIQGSIETMEGLRGHEGEKPAVLAKDGIAASREFMDRDPFGRFPKRSKVDKTEEVTVFAGDSIKLLNERKHRRNLEAMEIKAVPVA